MISHRAVPGSLLQGALVRQLSSKNSFGAWTHMQEKDILGLFHSSPESQSLCREPWAVPGEHFCLLSPARAGRAVPVWHLSRADVIRAVISVPTGAAVPSKPRDHSSDHSRLTAETHQSSFLAPCRSLELHSSSFRRMSRFKKKNQYYETSTSPYQAPRCFQEFQALVWAAEFWPKTLK